MMAVKPVVPEISEEKTAWGVRLTVKPFPDPQLSGLEISVEVTEPKPGRSPDIRTRFTAPPPSVMLRAADMKAWLGRMTEIQTRANAIADDMRERTKKSRPVKKTK